MPTKKEYKDFVLEQLNGLGEITCKQMMGEYLLYLNGVLFGGIYDDRLLVKKTVKNSCFSMSDALPYGGAKPMYNVDCIDDKQKLSDVEKHEFFTVFLTSNLSS